MAFFSILSIFFMKLQQTFQNKTPTDVFLQKYGLFFA